MKTKLVFVELLDELCGLDDVLDGETVVITTHPVVEVELKKRGIDCRNTTEYFGIHGHEQVSEATASVIEKIRPLLGELSHQDVDHAFERTAIFYLRFFLNYIFSHIYIVHKAVETLHPDHIVVFPSTPFSQIEARLLDGESPMWGNLLQQYGVKHQLKLSYPAGMHHVAPSQARETQSFWHRKFFFSLVFIWYRVGIRKRKLLFAPEDTYNMPSLLKTVSESIVDSLPVYLVARRATLKERLKEIFLARSFTFPTLPNATNRSDRDRFNRQWLDCLYRIRKTITENPLSFKFYDVDISRFVLDYFSNALTVEMHKLNGQIYSLYRVMAIKPPAAVFSQHAVGISYALGEICRKQGIPAILITHGSHVPHTQKIARTEWNEHARTLLVSHFPYVAVQTPWAERFVRSQTELLSKPISTGALLFAQKSKIDGAHGILRARIYGKHAEKKILLHAGSPKYWRSMRPWIYETLDEYVQNINHLIAAVQEVPEVHLAIRFRPRKELTTEGLKDLLLDSDCYEIYDKGRFDEHLLASDMLVSYSSTTLEEALQNKIPVLQYDPDGKYWHIPKCDDRSEKKRHKMAVQCASTHHELITILRNSLNNMMADGEASEWHTHILEKSDSWMQQMRLL